MGRPKGSRNSPGSAKTGRKPGHKLVEKYLQMTDSEILATKAAILEMVSSGKAMNIGAACREIGVSATKVYVWASNDPDFKMLCAQAREAVADLLEDELAHHANFIPKMMILKGLRPLYRDTYKFDVNNDRMEEMLAELKRLGTLRPQQALLAPVPAHVVTVEAPK